MPFVSYAQNLEDVVLRRVFSDVAVGTYVDIGAAWPEKDSVTLAFYKSGWSGVNVEPNSQLHAQLMADRTRDVNLNVLVGTNSGNSQFFEIIDPTGEATGLSTTDSEIAEHWRETGFSSSPHSVEQIPLAEVMARAGIPVGRFEYLKLDVEGAELDVLRSNDWKKWRPRVVACEVADPRNLSHGSDGELVLLMKEHGYEMKLFDGLNQFFEDASAPTGKSWAPANIFDDYVSARDEPLRNLAALVDQTRSDLADATTHLKWASEQVAVLNATLDRERVSFARDLSSSNAYSQELERQLEDLWNSRSWQFTRILRTIVSPFKRSE